MDAIWAVIYESLMYQDLFILLKWFLSSPLEVYTVLLQGQQGALTLDMNPSSGIKDWSICSSCKKCSGKLEFMTCLQVWFCK
jgi:hypothetical protein